MNFCQNVCISIGESIVCFGTVSFHLIVFWLKNAKINLFEEKRDLSAVFIELKCGLLQTCLTDMKKHNTLEMLLRAYFYAFFKILHFSSFKNHQ